jgi:hypothetical protein
MTRADQSVKELDCVVINGVAVPNGGSVRRRNGVEMIVTRIKGDRHGPYIVVHDPASNRAFIIEELGFGYLTPLVS